MERDPRTWVAESRNFAFGVITSQDACDIDPQACVRTENGIITTDGAYERRPGFKALEGISFEHPIQLVRWVETPEESGIVIVSGGDALFLPDGDTAQARYLMRFGICEEIAGYRGPALAATGPVLATERWGQVLIADGSIYSQAPVLVSIGLRSPNYGYPICSNIPGPLSDEVWYSDGVFVVQQRGVGPAEGLALVVQRQPQPSQPLSVSWDGETLLVLLATDADGNPTSTTQDVVTAINAIDGTPFVATAWGSSTAVCIELAQPRAFWGGNAGPVVAYSVGELPNWPVALAAEPSTGRLFMVDSSNRDALFYSDVRDPGTWPSENVLYAEDAITGLAAVSGTMLLMLERSILRIDGTDPTTWVVTQVPAHGAGMIPGAPKAILELEGVAAYASHGGIMAFNGARPTPLSLQVVGTDPATRLVPTGQDGIAPIMLRYREWLLIMWPDEDAGTTQAMLYAFREDRWCGPWTLPFVATDACWDARNGGADAPLLIGSESGVVYVDDWDDRADDGSEEPFEDVLVTKRYDGGREAIDKHVIEIRVLYEAGADSVATVELVREGDDEPVVTADVEIGEGKGVIVKRAAHFRCRDWGVVVRHAGPERFRVSGVETTYFFVRVR